MASTYTSSSGLEKIGSGEQSGRWGTTTNTNLDIIDRTVNGILELSVSGNGTTTQYLRSDGDGTFTWATPPDTNTTYTGDGNYGITISGTAIRLEADHRINNTGLDVYDGNTHDYTFYDASVGIRWYTAGAEEMRLQNNGDLHVDGNIVAYSTTVSDQRLKDDVETIETALDKVGNLRGVTYTWNAGSRKGQRDMGVIAQEVEAVIPEIVREKEMAFIDGETYKTVDYEKLTAVLIEAVKELKAEVDSLKAAQ
ncbi:MAG: tail fiber domain-containing protein [Opitutae bacterium]|nr:tail fiber domain-containing protein [Opitutae bacterium]